RGMPLANDVSLEKIAELTHGFVGADLEALAREAAMSAIRRILPAIDLDKAEIPYETLMSLEVTMENFRDALREVEPSAIREVFVEVPNVRWEDVGGLDAIKQELIEAIEFPLRYREVYDKLRIKPPKGILLYGAPGTGKTLLAKAVASQTSVNFISVKGAELLSRYVGESERAVRNIFKIAKQAAPSMIFFDEIDALAPRRSGASSEVADRVVSQLLTEMDGIEELSGVVVLAATNRIELIDSALLRSGRFELQLQLPLPDQSTRLAIFKVHLRDKPLESELLPIELSLKTEGCSGADIEFICRKASMLAARDFVLNQSRGNLRIGMQHFEQALQFLHLHDHIAR
ncbi:MAG: AAA family ATPase, partial [Candidatus Thermochlorobacter sp.]